MSGMLVFSGEVGSFTSKFHMEQVVPHQPLSVSDRQNKWAFTRYRNIDDQFPHLIRKHTSASQTDEHKSAVSHSS